MIAVEMEIPVSFSAPKSCKIACDNTASPCIDNSTATTKRTKRREEKRQERCCFGRSQLAIRNLLLGSRAH